MLFGQPCRELLHFCDCKAGEIPTNTIIYQFHKTPWHDDGSCKKLSGGMCVKATSLQQPPCNEEK